MKLVAADQNVNGQPLLGVIFESEEYNSKDYSIFKCEHVGNSAGSREFREFWGDKSELRRFADGATRETVIFESIEQAMKFAVKISFKIVIFFDFKNDTFFDLKNTTVSTSKNLSTSVSPVF